MAIPQINITFREQTQSQINRALRGTVGLVIRDETALGVHVYMSAADIDKTLSEENAKYIKRAFIGNETAPRLVVVAVINSPATIQEGLDMLLNSGQEINWIAPPPDGEDTDFTELEEWIIDRRDTHHATVKAVIPNATSKSAGLVNFTNTRIVDTGGNEILPADYLSRIAGLLAATPPTASVSYAKLSDLSSVDYLSPSAISEKVDNGEFVLMNDKTGVRVASGVASDGSKLKIIETRDLINETLDTLLRADYLCRVTNNYDGKQVVISAIKTALKEFEAEELIDTGSTVEIDLEAQKEYLRSNGITVADLTDDEIRQYNTGDKMFIIITIKINDVIEHINIIVNY